MVAAGFNPELSGTDNIVFNGAMLGFSRGEMLAKAEGIYEFTGLREFSEMPLKYYFSGMYMRLAFAIATEVNPDILLIDEALGVGDAAFLDKARSGSTTSSDARTPWSWSPTIWTHSANSAPEDSGSSTAGWSRMVRSTKSSRRYLAATVPQAAT